MHNMRNSLLRQINYRFEPWRREIISNEKGLNIKEKKECNKKFISIKEIIEIDIGFSKNIKKSKNRCSYKWNR